MKTNIKKTNPSEEEGFFKVNLPNASTVLALGILSILSCFIMGIPGIIIGIIARKISAKPMELYKIAPELYTKSSFKNIETGRICATIGIVLSSVFLVFVMIFLVVKGTVLSIFG